MSGKGSTAVVVTAEQVTTALKRAKVTTEEERALRMRYGARVDLKAPLPTSFEGNEELGDELMLIEMQLLRALKQRKAAVAPKSTVRNAAKDHIVASLKAKKK